MCDDKCATPTLTQDTAPMRGGTRALIAVAETGRTKLKTAARICYSRGMCGVHASLMCSDSPSHGRSLVGRWCVASRFRRMRMPSHWCATKKKKRSGSDSAIEPGWGAIRNQVHHLRWTPRLRYHGLLVKCIALTCPATWHALRTRRSACPPAPFRPG